MEKHSETITIKFFILFALISNQYYLSVKRFFSRASAAAKKSSISCEVGASGSLIVLGIMSFSPECTEQLVVKPPCVPRVPLFSLELLDGVVSRLRKKNHRKYLQKSIQKHKNSYSGSKSVQELLVIICYTEKTPSWFDYNSNECIKQPKTSLANYGKSHSLKAKNLQGTQHRYKKNGDHNKFTKKLLEKRKNI